MKQENIFNNVSFNTERLTLRRIKEEDVKDYFEILSDEETLKYLNGVMTEDGVRNYIFNQIKKDLNDYGGRYAVVLNSENKVIGEISLKYDENNNKVEIGCLFNRNYWGNGYAIESIKFLVNFLFTKLNINRIEGDCITENEASLKMFKKLNMQYEGTHRKSRYIKRFNKYYDVCYYGLLREDYLK